MGEQESSITWSLERDQVIQLGRLSGIENVEGEIENVIFASKGRKSQIYHILSI